jgi:hypothetical protein
MTGPRFAKLASKVLADRESDASAPPSAEARAAAIAVVERAIAARAQSRRRVRALVGVCAVAAVVAAAVGVTRYASHRGAPASTAQSLPAIAGTVTVVAHPEGGGASLVGLGAPAPLAEGRALAAGSRVVTAPNGRAMLAFSTGTSLTLEEGADMSIVEGAAQQVLALGSGAIDAHVSKLAPGERFMVRTSDTEVEVRGTAFRVAVVPADPACGSGTITRVSVTEGVVVIRHDNVEAQVGEGGTWPSDCADKRPTSQASVAMPAPGGSSSAAAQRASSSLAEQNDLFAQAVAAKRRGATAEAIAGFDRFLARYPASPLAESATVERMRLLRANDPARATGAAKQYLVHYPSGFARAEAEAIAGRGP